MEIGVNVLISRCHSSWFGFMWLLVNHSKSFSAAFSKDVMTFRGVSPDTICNFLFYLFVCTIFIYNIYKNKYKRSIIICIVGNINIINHYKKITYKNIKQ